MERVHARKQRRDSLVALILLNLTAAVRSLRLRKVANSSTIAVAAVAKEKTPRVRSAAAEIDGSRRLPPLPQKVTSSPMTAPAASRVEIHSQVNL
jgi:hypothetical protein